MPRDADRPTLKSAFEAIWSRQPEARALAARRDAARAEQLTARAWTPEPPTLELAARTDRLIRLPGSNGFEAGVSIPLWLPDERGRSQARADAEVRAVESRAAAARLRVAAGVRDAWWTWQRAKIDAVIANDRLDSVRRIAADVRRRVGAGDLARADQHQADGAVAAAESALAQSEASLAVALHQLRAMTATPEAFGRSEASSADGEPEPSNAESSPGDAPAHAELQALQDRAGVAERSVELAQTQARAAPELVFTGSRDRGAFGEPYQQAFTVGVRFPFGAGPRHDARTASARAELLELLAQIELERARLAAERESARVRADSARLQLAAAERRATLARESRGFFDKSFRLGETDLPTRLRIEAEAADAERQAARARVDLAAAISAWRQALGLLPQ